MKVIQENTKRLLSLQFSPFVLSEETDKILYELSKKRRLVLLHFTKKKQGTIVTLLEYSGLLKGQKLYYSPPLLRRFGTGSTFLLGFLETKAGKYRGLKVCLVWENLALSGCEF